MSILFSSKPLLQSRSTWQQRYLRQVLDLLSALIIATISFGLYTLDDVSAEQHHDTQTESNRNSTTQQTPPSIPSQSLPSCPEWILTLPRVPFKDPSALNSTARECPFDTIFVPISTGIFLLMYLLLVVACAFGLFWKRQNAHIKARTSAGMVFTLVNSVCFVLGLASRFIAGREVYPCLLYSVCFFVIPANMTVTSAMRFLTLYIQFKVNLLKANYFKEMEKVHATVFCKTRESVVIPSGTLSTLGGEFNEKQTVSTGQLKDSNILDNTNSPLLLTTHKMKDRERLYFKIHSLLSSHGICTFLLLLVVIAHVNLWFWAGVIENTFFSERPIFMKESMFSFKGCAATFVPSFMSLSLFFIYFVVECICAFILIFKTDKDTWNMKKEALLLIPIQFILTVCYVTSEQVVYFGYLDRIVPKGLIIMTYSAIELFITVFLPVCYAIHTDRTKPVCTFQNELEMILNQQETFEILLDFSRKSYCPESVTIFREIDKYKKCKHKKQLALYIVETYLSEGGAEELNLPNVVAIHEEILFKIHTCDMLPDTLFDEVYLLSMQNLTDIYNRLKKQNPKIKEMAEQWKNQTITTQIQPFQNESTKAMLFYSSR
ncbi:hypothetical protein C9374_009192 [Naegleria lovaniensis]|uniref:RGS domain-containing protein n=1 Tax=Naegleria lovaniensis TaxID=51637 RepID=A0AA88GJM2_NAELO|nr:uncharacterized protein C9374_009192 [Naegleria lovaniensis]KAG2377676.1 hypothetical protein C9374_009192 [Naegleria lovaniensis]